MIKSVCNALQKLCSRCTPNRYRAIYACGQMQFRNDPTSLQDARRHTLIYEHQGMWPRTIFMWKLQAANNLIFDKFAIALRCVTTHCCSQRKDRYTVYSLWIPQTACWDVVVVQNCLHARANSMNQIVSKVVRNTSRKFLLCMLHWLSKQRQTYNLSNLGEETPSAIMWSQKISVSLWFCGRSCFCWIRLWSVLFICSR